MSPAQLPGSTSSPNSPGNRTPPILKNYYRQKRKTTVKHQTLNLQAFFTTRSSSLGDTTRLEDVIRLDTYWRTWAGSGSDWYLKWPARASFLRTRVNLTDGDLGVGAGGRTGSGWSEETVVRKRVRNRIWNSNDRNRVRNRIWNRDRIGERRTRLVPSPPTLSGHVTGLLTAPAQAREGAGSGQMVWFFTDTTLDRLAGIPRTTNETKNIERRRDRRRHGHQKETVTVTQFREIFKIRMTDRIDIAKGGQGRLDRLIGQFHRKISNINCSSVHTRRSHRDFSALKNKITGQQLLPEGRIAHGDANTAPRGGTEYKRSLFRATRGLTGGTGPPRHATGTLPAGSVVGRLKETNQPWKKLR